MITPQNASDLGLSLGDHAVEDLHLNQILLDLY